MMMATREGTAGYAGRFRGHRQFYREVQGLTVSSLGIGTYLGAMDEATNRSYEEALDVAVSNGINFIDTSLNYRHQLSERAIGTALERMLRRRTVEREAVVVCTKAGYVVPGAVGKGALEPGDLVGGSHAMSPTFVRDQLDRSRRNLKLDTVDVLYLHNPETQLAHLGEDEVYERFASAFETLEELASEGRIQYYGVATWQGLREADGLSLRRLEETARAIAGELHRFRFIQLPLNLAMTEALRLRDAEGKSVLDLAVEFDISVVASASMLQSRLTQDLPEALRERMPGLSTDAQRAIQFTRSSPGVDVALAGMSRAEHVDENLGVAAVEPIALDEYLALFRSAS